MARFYNPHDVLHGVLAITTVQSITLRKNWTRLAGQGDDDLTDSFQAKTNMQVNGTIVIQDPIQAAVLIDKAGATLAWAGTPEEGGVAKAIEVTGVSFFTMDETDAHNALDGVTLGWNAYSPSGSNPVTIGLDT